MKKLISILCLAILLSGCGENWRRTDDADKKALSVSILPLKYIVDRITGNDFDVTVMVPPGSSPETYEPTPSQMALIGRSRLLFVTGLIDFEQQLATRINDMGTSTQVIDLSKNIELINGHCHHITNGKSHAHGTDPHIWSSPKNLRQMAATAWRQIALLYPDSTRYSANYKALDAQFDSLDSSIRAHINNCNSKYFIIFHPALTYYARDYDLEQISLEEEGKEPSVERMKTVIKRAREGGKTRIFYQKQFSPATVETLAQELGAQCVEIDPLREDVVENLIDITYKITSDGADRD